MNSDKPSGIELDDFLPKQMQGMGLRGGGGGGQEPASRFSAYGKGFDQDYSETEVTNNMLRGHQSMVSVLATRGRNIEIIHKLWQNKDAKTGESHRRNLSRRWPHATLFF